MAIVRDAGLTTIERYFVETEDDEVMEFRKIGEPAVMRIVATDILHESDCGCVALNLSDEVEVRDAFHNMMANGEKHYPDAKIDGCIIAGRTRCRDHSRHSP